MFNPIFPSPRGNHATISTTRPTPQQPANTAITTNRPLGNHLPHSLDLNLPAPEESESLPARVPMIPWYSHSAISQQDRGKQPMPPDQGPLREPFQAAQEVHAAQLPDAPWHVPDEEDSTILSNVFTPWNNKGKRKANSPPVGYRRLPPRPFRMHEGQSSNSVPSLPGQLLNLPSSSHSLQPPLFNPFVSASHQAGPWPVSSRANSSFLQPGRPPQALKKFGLFNIPKKFIQAFQPFCQQNPQLLSEKIHEIQKHFVEAQPSFNSLKPKSLTKYIFAFLNKSNQIPQKQRDFSAAFQNFYLQNPDASDQTFNTLTKQFREAQPNSPFARLKDGSLRNYISDFFKRNRTLRTRNQQT